MYSILSIFKLEGNIDGVRQAIVQLSSYFKLETQLHGR